ncbi:adenylate/guanylate cyclase domain-containing protein [Ramlibacter albus]|uniref:Response regulator n=1 Tax=Ramlibacter albus TaxID=2079448 RepID=A0A923M972_9BURK|nr:adenylate/guanylate cyclase domain-containing protein [Ramlibacter albus]MBC5765991.1 response regulator [Ramlibacter albus]
MNAQRVLIVDDVPANVRVLAKILEASGFAVETAGGGVEGLARIREGGIDIVLLDVMMPDMSGYEVCRAVRADEKTAVLPVVLVTALDDVEERVKGIEAGADDFLSKPIRQPELLARVRSLLRIKAYHDTIVAQRAQLEEWTRTLEQRVADAVGEIERHGRLKRFLAPQIAEMLLGEGKEELLRSHRREITVVFIDLRGFTAFTELSDPEEVMRVINDYYGVMGALVQEHGGTLANYAGDGMMILFNDPVPTPAPAADAARMALAMQAAYAGLSQQWKAQGYDLKMGVGIAQGYATVGVIGFEGRRDYGAIGPVCNLSARLCSEAKGDEILVSQRVVGALGDAFRTEPMGEVTLKGVHKPQPVFRLLGAAA